ncbi:MAG: FHA domain-containing protein [Bdellovibrionales bacterium]|nr:FHA domain-containing protein [Bdellovibrionales bacterium]
MDEQSRKAESHLAVKVFLHKQLQKVIRLDPNATYIGRMPENHVVIDDEKASRSHAKILFEKGNYYVEDQKSENGVYLNGEKVQKAQISIGDQILIGSHILEISPAQDNVQPASLDEQIELATDEDWRLEDTISVHTGKRPAIVETPRPSPQAALPKKEASTPSIAQNASQPSLPELFMVLKIGNESIEKKVVFETGRKLKQPSDENAIVIALKIGRWVMEKKIQLVE